MNKEIEKLRNERNGLQTLIRKSQIRLSEIEVEEAKLEKVIYPLGYWRPEIGERYCVYGPFLPWDNDDDDILNLSLGTVFKTGEEAEKVLSQRTAYSKLVRTIAEVNHENCDKNGNPWRPNWGDGKQKKYLMAYNWYVPMLDSSSVNVMQYAPDYLYFAKKSFSEIRNRLGEKTIKLALGVEDEV